MRQQIEVQDTTLSLQSLVAQVETGDEVILLRDGRPVARIVSEGTQQEYKSELTPEQQARARAANESIRALAEELNLGPFDFEQFKRDRDEGRR